MITNIFILPFLFLLMISCSSTDNSNYNLNNIDVPVVSTAAKESKIFIKITRPRDILLNKIVTINDDNIQLVNAINAVVPNISIRANDDAVDLKKIISVRYIEHSFEGLLDYLSKITNYGIELTDGVVVISAKKSKVWNLAAMSINVSGTEINLSGGENKNWSKIITAIKELLGDGATLIDNQQTGEVYAIAKPRNILLVDKFIQSTITQTEKQINLKITVLDVIVNKSQAKGIDWSLVSEGTNGVIGIQSAALQTLDAAGVLSFGTVDKAKPLVKGDISAKLLINLLEKQGTVAVQNQPNITVTNGNQAYVSTGDEFSYVASIAANTDQSGNVVSTAQVERLNVGIELQVGAKILANDRVLINVLPIISSLQSFTTITSSEQSFQTPNIALQKLSTQIIARNGQTIRLGGLISERIANASKFLPNQSDSSLLSFFFDSDNKASERREIVILIQPTIIK